MSQLASLLRRFDELYPRRARGGLYALAGFDLQLRAHLADFAAALVSARDAESCGVHFFEAFSDFVRQAGPKKVCVQVKRTLDSQTMSRAAAGFVVLDEFMEREAPSIRDEICFEVLSESGDPNLMSAEAWDGIELPTGIEDRSRRQTRLKALRSQGRLLAPREEQDPWWRLIATVYPVLDDPFAFGREALEICLARGVDAEDAKRVRNHIAEAFFKRRRNIQTFPGEALTREKFEPRASPSRDIVLGEVPTIAHLLDGRFMDRPERLQDAAGALDGVLAERAWHAGPQVYALWLEGRSGNGKSVLLLQLMRKAVMGGASVIWLDDGSADLLPLLQAWAISSQITVDPIFVFVDDFNAPHKREMIDFDAMARLLRRHSETHWPILVTCGPPEQHEELKSTGHDDAFRISTWRLPPAGATERERLKAWFMERTGEVPRTGSAFEQDEGLMISLVFEMRRGDLAQFGRRFRRRLEGEGLVEALALPLALNRLYIWAPAAWLDQEHADALRRVNRDRDFSILSDERRLGGYLRLTHPHLSDAIYRCIRPRADAIVFSRDLANTFARALVADPMVAKLIPRRVAESHGRLGILDSLEVARGIARVWSSIPDVEVRFSSADRPYLWAYWTRCCRQWPEIADILGGASPLERARDALSTDHKTWGFIWLVLWECEPGHGGLAQDAWRWLRRECARRADRSDWNYVWQRLVECRAVLPEEMELAGLLRLGRQWLSGREDRPDWSYVWRGLVQCREDLPKGVELAGLLRLGHEWLSERQDRLDWTFVWQRLFEHADVSEKMVIAELGWTWLSTEKNKSRGEWDKIYEACLLSGFKDRGFCEAGVEWLMDNASQPQAPGIALPLLRALGKLDESHPLAIWIRRWLAAHHPHPFWMPVWEGLWNACPRASTVDLVLPWMRSGPSKDSIGFVGLILGEGLGRDDLLPQDRTAISSCLEEVEQEGDFVARPLAKSMYGMALLDTEQSSGLKWCQDALAGAENRPVREQAVLLLNLGVAQRKCHLVADSIATLQKARRFDPDNASIYYALARSYEAAGELEEAISLLHLAVGKRPEGYPKAAAKLAELQGFAAAGGE